MLTWRDPNLTIAQINTLRAQNNQIPQKDDSTPDRASTSSSKDTNSSFIRRVNIKNLARDRGSRSNVQISSPVLLFSSNDKALPPRPDQLSAGESDRSGRSDQCIAASPLRPDTQSPATSPPKRPPRPPQGLHEYSSSDASHSRSKAPDESFWSYTLASPSAKRRMRLRTGSVATSPRLNPWKQTVYLPGPIMLQPSLGVRSVSAVDPCQETLNLVFQHGATRSEEATSMGTCAFFDDMLRDDLNAASESDDGVHSTSYADALAMPPDHDVYFGDVPTHKRWQRFSTPRKLGTIVKQGHDAQHSTVSTSLHLATGVTEAAVSQEVMPARPD